MMTTQEDVVGLKPYESTDFSSSISKTLESQDGDGEGYADGLRKITAAGCFQSNTALAQEDSKNKRKS